MTTHAPAEPLADEAAPSARRELRRGVSEDEAMGARAHSRRTWIWGSLFALWALAVLVFWAFEALPFMDLPAHAGLIALRHRFEVSPFDQDYFVLASRLGPYSLFRFLGEAFHRVLGPVGAVRALGTLPVLATPAALYFARKRLHGDGSPTTLFLGIALSFGLMTLLGFASYLLGLAVMLVVLTAWLELMAAADEGARTFAKEAWLAVGAVFLFVAHGHAFVLGLGLMSAATVLGARGTARRRIARVRAFVPALLLSSYVAWTTRLGSLPQGSAPLPEVALNPVFEGPLEKLSLLVTTTMTTRTGLDVLAGLLLWALVLTGAWRTARATFGPRGAAVQARATAHEGHARTLLCLAALTFVVFVALPHSIGWFGFVDGRLVPLVLFLLVMAYGEGRAPRSMRVGAPLAALLVVGLALAGSYRFQHEARGFKEVLAHVPAGARLLNLPIDPNSDVFTAHPFIHYDKLVLTERPIVVSDVWFHQGTALYPTEKNPALRLPKTYSESNLVRIDWPEYRLADWTHVLIRTRPEGAPGPLPDALRLAAHEGGWWLYETAR